MAIVSGALQIYIYNVTLKTSAWLQLLLFCLFVICFVFLRRVGGAPLSMAFIFTLICGSNPPFPWHRKKKKQKKKTSLFIHKMVPLLGFFLWTHMLTHSLSHTQMHTVVSRDARPRKSRTMQQSFQQGLEGETGSMEREARHLRKAFEF